MCSNMKENKPLISFIITYYNLPVEMLYKCIDSILHLSLHPSEREIIVVDDGSDNSPMNELMKYGDDIMYVRQVNGGVSVARNTGIKIAKGDYIQLIDGDDFLLDKPYEQCVDIIRNNPNADIVLFDFTKNAHQSSFNVGATLITSGATFMRNHNLQGSACCCLFRASIKGTLEFTPGICYGEDEEFTPQLLLRAETIYYTTIPAYYYREHHASTIHQKDKKNVLKRLEDNKTVILHLHQMADHLPINDKHALQRRVAQLTMDYLYNIIMLTRSNKMLNEQIEKLHDEGLFPLPKANYSKKYVWFRRLTKSSIGRTILLYTLPFMKQER